MLQTRSSSNSATRASAIAAAQSERPFACAAGCPFFQQGACKKMDTGGPLARIARKQLIYSEGDAAAHCYKVMEGAVRVSRILSDGHRQVLDIFLPGDTFGIEVAETYGATAEAVGDVVLLRCPRACIDHRSEVDHRREMLAMMSRSLSAAQDHVAMLGHQGAKERVAAFIIRLAQGQNRGANQLLDLPVGRQDIADYLGLTIETTCRTLTDLKTNLVISAPSRHQLVIRNMARLEAVAEGEA
jgi:CRP/FNR family nitrogen fixation transcriptional regulator